MCHNDIERKDLGRVRDSWRGNVPVGFRQQQMDHRESGSTDETWNPPLFHS